MGFPAKTAEGQTVDIVNKDGGDPEILTDSEGNQWTASQNHGLQLVPLVAEGDSLVGSDTVEYLNAPEPSEAASETGELPALGVDDDPLGSPLAGDEGVAASTAEGVAAGDAVPDDATPVDPWDVPTAPEV